jgi:hypothetical protein
MAASVAQVLSPGVGWTVVICLGVAFSGLMLLIIFVQNRYAPTAHGSNDNDEFSSASRSVKPGLIACGIVSAWTWAATLEQSAAVVSLDVKITEAPLSHVAHCSSVFSRILRHTNTVFLGPTGMRQARPFRSSCSPSLVPT